MRRVVDGMRELDVGGREDVVVATLEEGPDVEDCVVRTLGELSRTDEDAA